MPKNNWWKHFFSGLAVDMWRLVIPEEQTRKEADFIQSMLGIAPPSKVLDVPCGNGRLSLELAARGFQLTGVDISREFLQEARTNAAKKQLKVVWERRDMRNLPWKASFNGVVCFGNSFGYLDEEGNAEFLRAVRRVLKAGGRFVLDASSVAENVLPKIQEHSEMQVGDIVFVEDNRYDHVNGRLDTEYTFVLGNQTEKKSGSHRIYTFRELQRLLSEAGFTIHEAYGSIDLEEFKFGSQGLYFVAAKGG